MTNDSILFHAKVSPPVLVGGARNSMSSILFSALAIITSQYWTPSFGVKTAKIGLPSIFVNTNGATIVNIYHIAIYSI